MKEDVCLEPLVIAVTAGLLHEQLDAAVDTFGQVVAETMLDDTHNAGEVGLERAPQSFRLQARAVLKALRFKSSKRAAYGPSMEASVNRHGAGKQLGCRQGIHALR